MKRPFVDSDEDDGILEIGRSRRRKARWWWSFLVVAAVGAGFILYLRWAAGRRLEAALEYDRKFGVSRRLGDIAMPVPLRDEDNAAAGFGAVVDDASRDSVLMQDLAYSHFGAVDLDPRPRKGALAELDRPFGKFLDRLVLASKIKACDFHPESPKLWVNLSESADPIAADLAGRPMFDRIDVLFILTEALAYRGGRRLSAGDAAGYDDLQAANRIAVDLEEFPGQSFVLAGSWIETVVRRFLNQRISRPDVDPVALAFAEKICAQVKDQIPNYRRWLTADMAALLDMVDAGDFDQREGGAGLQGWFDRLTGERTRLKAMVAEWVGLQAHQFRLGFPLAPKRPETAPGMEKLFDVTKTESPIFSYRVSKGNAAAEVCSRQILTPRRLFLTEVLILRYRMNTGRLPDTVGQAGDIPLDPLDGKPIRYRQTHHGFEIWAVDQNGVDEGGTPPTALLSPHDTIVWWPQTSPPPWIADIPKWELHPPKTPPGKVFVPHVNSATMSQ